MATPKRRSVTAAKGMDRKEQSGRAGSPGKASPGRKAKRPSQYTAWANVSDTRRRTMAAIRSRDTKPELLVRRLLHAHGYRFVVGKRVAGYRPDVLFTRRRKAVFVHGCFWHGHHACGHDKIPKTRSDYWRDKIEGNRARDLRAQVALEAADWDVLVLWECEIARDHELASRLVQFLGPPSWDQAAREAETTRRTLVKRPLAHHSNRLLFPSPLL